MKSIQQQLERWSASLSQEVSVGGLLARCPIAHKWKAPFRSILIREALLWRMHDLGQQTLILTEGKHILGARILLRSAIETLAFLIYLNQKTSAVLLGDLPFFEYEALTKQLLLGSRNESTDYSSVNILSVLRQAEKVHPGLHAMHEDLSESAHPNYDGVLVAYSKTNPAEFETRFLNNWFELFGGVQEPANAFVFAIFEHEYNETWPGQMKALEEWLRANDAVLEEQRVAEGS